MSRCPGSPGSPGGPGSPGVQVCRCVGVHVSVQVCRVCRVCRVCMLCRLSRCAGVQVCRCPNSSFPSQRPAHFFFPGGQFSRPRGHSSFPIHDAILFVSSRRQIESAVLNVAPFTRGSKFFFCSLLIFLISSWHRQAPWSLIRVKRAHVYRAPQKAILSHLVGHLCRKIFGFLQQAWQYAHIKSTSEKCPR